MSTHRTGWTYGDQQYPSSAWLTVLGSAYRRPVLHATQADAETALDAAGMRHAKHMRIVVARVTELPHGGVSGGYAYRIHEVAG